MWYVCAGRVGPDPSSLVLPVHPRGAALAAAGAWMWLDVGVTAAQTGVQGCRDSCHT